MERDCSSETVRAQLRSLLPSPVSKICPGTGVDRHTMRSSMTTAANPPAPGALRTAELRLLVASAMGERAERLSELASQIDDWPRLYHLAARHGLRAAVYDGLLTARTELPASVAGAWRGFAEENTRRNLRLTAMLLHLIEEFARAGIRVLAYKGPALAATAYTTAAAREISDLDLLVWPTDVEPAETVARCIGYRRLFPLTRRQREVYMRNECELDLVSPEGELLDLHWALAPRHYGVDFNFAACWERRKQVRIAGRSVATLGDADCVLTLAVHGSKHAWERLNWVVDLARFVRAHPQLDWDEIIRQAQACGAIRALWLALSLCEAVTATEMPQALRTQMAADRAAMRMTAAAVERFHGGLRLAEAERWRMSFRLQSRARWRSLAFFAFNSGVAEWKRARLPEPLFPLYVPLRWWRIASAATRRGPASND